MAAGTIRYWAAAKAAAGVGEDTADASTLAEALAAALARHADRPRLAEVLTVCSFVVDGQPTGRRPHDEVVLAEGWVAGGVAAVRRRVTLVRLVERCADAGAGHDARGWPARARRVRRTGWLAIAVVGLAALLAYGLLAGRNLPEPAPAGALVVLTAAGAVLSVLASDVEPGAETSFGPVLRAVGPAIVAVLLVVLARPKARERAVEWLATTAAGVRARRARRRRARARTPARPRPRTCCDHGSGGVVGSAAAVPPPRSADARLALVARRSAGRRRGVAAFVAPVGLVDRTDRLVLAVAVAVAAGVGARPLPGSGPRALVAPSSADRLCRARGCRTRRGHHDPGAPRLTD